ncbi:protein FAM210B, mitochondrial [Xyrauchen texanus]|uniref:protein FAM210B, mitochondrial n=1 Tax=Xyrauchen texanus TaxID=154827 RepID=UPI002241C532|nr:protein FAM210B, mitochondrial [Xyrauchen texanus]
MFHSSVSVASSLLKRVNFTGAAGDMTYTLRNYRRFSKRNTAVFPRRDERSGVECVHDISFRSASGRVTHARMTLFTLNATPRREFGDWTNAKIVKVNELESFLSGRASVVTVQTRRSSATPEKSREERAAEVRTEAHPSGSGAPGVPAESDGNPSKTQQLRKVFKEYGAVGVSFHIGISLISLGIFYLAVSSGIDMAAVLCKVGFSESVVQSKMAAGTSTFVLAYAVHKLFAPVRISITLVSVPLIVRYLRKTGLFKPRTSAP